MAQIGNAALTAGGLYGTYKFTDKGAKAFHEVTYCRPEFKRLIKNSHKMLVGFFNKMGDVMFKHPKMESLLQSLKDHHPNLHQNIKGRLALATTAGIAALALITRGIYKAGEIAGEHK